MSLPSIVGGSRRLLAGRLVFYGLAQAATAFGLAGLVHYALAATRAGGFSWTLVSGIAALAAGRLGLRTLEARDAEALGQDYVIRLRKRILRSAALRPWQAKQRQRWGVTMSRLVTDLNALRNWVSLGFARMISGSVALAGLLGALVFFHPPTAWAVATVSALMVGWAALLTPSLRGQVLATRKERGRLANCVGEQILAGPTARQFGRVEHGLDRVFRRGRRLRAAMMRRATLAALLRGGPELAHGLALVGILYALAVPTAEYTGRAAVILLLLGMIIAALRDLARAWDYRIAFEEGRRRIAQLLNEPSLPIATQPREVPGEGPVTLAFEAVSPDGKQRPLTVAAMAGERIVVVGPSGAGKSMLLRLAARLFDPVLGRIVIDGVPVTEIMNLHRIVQLVSADVPLLRGTVAQNLSYANPSAETAQREAIAGLCGILGEAELFPDGMNTWLSEGGANLASGARARIALARALLANPRLLLVDDPVFLLDQAAAQILSNALAHARATVLLVAAEPPWPIQPVQIWRLSRQALVVERASERQLSADHRPPPSLEKPVSAETFTLLPEERSNTKKATKSETKASMFPNAEHSHRDALPCADEQPPRNGLSQPKGS